MNHHYKDIRNRIKEPPIWWDEHAVPRYCVFTPDETANIYANKVALVVIECQDCGTLFKVCFSQSTIDLYDPETKTFNENWDIEERIKNKTIHFGDPPNACSENCVAGATMNSIPIEVLEFWKRERLPQFKLYKWERVTELEIGITPSWYYDKR